MILAKLMQQLQKISDVPFELVFLSMDPGYNEKNRKKIEDNAKLMNIPIQFFDSDIFEVTAKTEKNPCYLCARMRRGCLYNKAKELVADAERKYNRAKDALEEQRAITSRDLEALGASKIQSWSDWRSCKKIE